MNPSPPPHLTKETLRVWHGWDDIGDKEVAREAAAKGSHIDLAIQYLSQRKKVNLDVTKQWFKQQVTEWVYELLHRRQIFKASHILNNTHVDAASEFEKIFYKSTDVHLREYIGNHLVKCGQIGKDSQQLWSFLNLILENKELLSESVASVDSLESLDKLNDNIKSEAAVILFIKTEDANLHSFLNGDTLWRYLILNSDLDYIKKWIHVRFGLNELDNVVEGNLTEQFRRFPIEKEMIDLISDKDLSVSEYVKNAIYNELSGFGIFSSEENSGFISIIRRLKTSFNLSNLYQILSNSSSVVCVDKFIKLLTDFCLRHGYFHILNTCLDRIKIPTAIEETQVSLIRELRLLVLDFNEQLLFDNILHISCLLSNDIVNHFNENLVLFLSFLLFNKDIDVYNLLVNHEELIVNGIQLNDCLFTLTKSLKIFNNILSNKLTAFTQCNLNVYDLILIHLKMDTRLLLPLTCENNNFTDFLKTISKYGYSKELNYKYYIKEGRPCIAAKLFIVQELKLSVTIQENYRKKIERQLCQLVVVNFDHDGICASCISFAKMIGIDSMKIRVLVSIAKTLYKSKNNRDALMEILLKSEDEPYHVQNLLEATLMETIDIDEVSSASNLIQALQLYEIAVLYSRFSVLKLPESFLRHCASRNLWLPFLVFVEIYHYPLDQVKLLIQFFKSPNMLEHLTHGVVNDIQVEDKNILIRDRDSRKYLLSKVGVRQSIDVLNQLTTQSVKSQSSLESQESSTGSDLFEIDISNIKATLLQTLIRCHNSTDPPKALLQASQLYRNPLLAIFATSYEPDSLVTNWLTWLSVSCELCKVFTNYESVAISATAVRNLLEDCLKNCYPKTISESLEIFMSDHPLKIFMEFLIFCQDLNFNNDVLTSHLRLFESSQKSSRKNSIISDTDHELTYLTNKLWIELTALRLLSALLEFNCNSLYEQILIVQNLCKIKVWEYFSCECVNFSNLLSILKTLHAAKSGTRLNLSIMFDTKNSRQAIVSCINDLLAKQQYEVALDIAKIENLPVDLILVKKWQNKITDRSDTNFWNTCNETFISFNVTADYVVEFYLDCAEKVDDSDEKFVLFKLAADWATKFDLSYKYELEKKMWLAFLQLDSKHRSLDIFSTNASSLLYQAHMETVEHVVPYEAELNQEFIARLDDLIAFVLNNNNFGLALKLQKMFGAKSADLEILKLCHCLAEGILLPYQLNAEQRLLLSKVSRLRQFSQRRQFFSKKLSSLSLYSQSPANSLQMQTVDSVDSYLSDNLTALKLLCEHLHNGIEIGRNVFMQYRISVNIEIPYNVVVLTTDYMKLLKDALHDDCINKLDVVHDFFLAFKWTKHEITDFICEELVNATTAYIAMCLDALLMWDLNVDEDFQLILQLFQDNCSLLGGKLYSYANTFYKSRVESIQNLKASDLHFVIELFIRAHDCFTADCNMEGISMVLKKCKEMIMTLLVLQDWKLMVRLLTGIARYTEMNYVFQILNENDQFEFLLRKGFRKDNSLKVALLEYLQKYCTDNKDLYKIVALHFALFSEVAVLWEREAQGIIKNLISISILEMQNNKMSFDEGTYVLIQNNDSTKICLNKAMENYIHATEFHLQGEKLTNATHSAKQAELIALQLAYLDETPVNTSVSCLLHLKHFQITKLICSKLKFEQAMLLTDAYNFQPNWANVLYEQYIVNQNAVFLEDFLKHLPLTDTLVQDMSRKFITSNVNSPDEVKCMKNIVNNFKSLHMKYRMASELGFTDVVEDMIANGQMVYLKDTVWKKGYKN